MRRHLHPRMLATLAASIAVLSLDSVFPRGVATWLLQVVVVWSAMSWTTRKELMVVGLWAAACADAGYWIAPKEGVQLAVHWFNQILCVSAILLLVHIGLKERAAQAEIRVLRGLLSICSTCKRIRNKTGQWEQLEVYIKHHSEAEFTHGLCPQCADEFERQMAG